LNKNQHKNHRLQKAWNEYGSNQFTWEVLEYVYRLSLLWEVEGENIGRYKSDNPRFGFNLKLADGRLSEESLRREWRPGLLISSKRVGEFKFQERKAGVWRREPERVCEACGKIYKPTKYVQKYCSSACSGSQRRKIKWPDNLVELVDRSNISQVARSLGVSDNAVRKRLLRYHSRELI
jgi:hypothetical protein